MLDWELWYQDTFDPECPRRVEVAGSGLVPGLLALWAHHLLESVGANGQVGFSRFNLWLISAGQSIQIVGKRRGMTRLRGWVYGELERGKDGAEPTRSIGLLRKVAQAHARLFLTGETSLAILAAAASARDREAFEAWLDAFE